MPYRTDQEHSQAARNSRSLFLVLAFICLLLVITGRLWYLQVVKYEENLHRSENNRMDTHIITAARGDILDREGRVLVRNRPSYQVSIMYSEVENREKLVQTLMQIRKKNGEAIFDTAEVNFRLDQAKYRLHLRNQWLRILEDAPSEVVALLEERSHELPGIKVLTEPRREYIHGTLAAHTLGYTGQIKEDELEMEKYAGYQFNDVVGRKGLEAFYESEFKGEDGVEYNEVDHLHRSLGRLEGMPHKDPVPGNSLITTIDLDLQRVAEKAFPDSMIGAAVAIDPRNGEVLAMLSSPRLNPNIFSLNSRSRKKQWAKVALDSTKPLWNRAVVGRYPPGSIFKIYPSMAGLEGGYVTENSKPYKPCRGAYRYGRGVWKCWKHSGHGHVDVIDALRESCDVYYYQLILQVGIEAVNKYAAMYGLGMMPGLDLALPKKAAGQLVDSAWYKEHNRYWTRGNLLNLSIGQGEILVTPLQMAASYGAVGLGDTLFTPHLMKEIRDAEGKLVRKYKPKPLVVANIKPETHRIILKGLDEVMHAPGGTGRRARVPGVKVGGKTGSAEWGIKGSTTHAWFAAVAPLDNPEIAVAVLAEGAGHGGSVAAPIAGKILNAYFDKKKKRLQSDSVNQIKKGAE